MAVAVAVAVAVTVTVAVAAAVAAEFESLNQGALTEGEGSVQLTSLCANLFR